MRGDTLIIVFVPECVPFAWPVHVFVHLSRTSCYIVTHNLVLAWSWPDPSNAKSASEEPNVFPLHFSSCLHLRSTGVG